MGVTPLWTGFHLYDYFERYFGISGFLTDFFGKRAELDTNFANFRAEIG